MLSRYRTLKTKLLRIKKSIWLRKQRNVFVEFIGELKHSDNELLQSLT